MRIRTLPALTLALTAIAAAPAHAEWKNYVSRELGFSFSAPSEVKAELGTYRGEVAGPRQTTVFRCTDNNIEYKVTVLAFSQAQMDGAILIGEREFLFRQRNKVVMDAFSQVGTGKDSVYGHKIVVDLAKGRTMAAVYFTNGKLYTVEADLPPDGDYQAPEPKRFIDSIAFDLSRVAPGTIEVQAPKVE